MKNLRKKLMSLSMVGVFVFLTYLLFVPMTVHADEASVTSDEYQIINNVIYTGSSEFDMSKVNIPVGYDKEYDSASKKLLLSKSDSQYVYDIVSLSKSDLTIRDNRVIYYTGNFDVNKVNFVTSNDVPVFKGIDPYLPSNYNDQLTLPCFIRTALEDNGNSLKVYVGKFNMTVIGIGAFDANAKQYNETLVDSFPILQSPSSSDVAEIRVYNSDNKLTFKQRYTSPTQTIYKINDVAKSGNKVEAYFFADTTVDARIIIQDNAQVEMFLNGHMVRRVYANHSDGEVINVGEGAKLTVYGGSDEVAKNIEHELYYTDTKGDYVRDKVVTIKGGLLTGGHSNSGAGGILAKEDSKITLNDVSLSGNIARGENGGGITLDGPNIKLIMNNSTISYNYAGGNDGLTEGFGGGIYVYGGIATDAEYCTVEMHNSHIDNNFATWGGGIYVDAEHFTLIGDAEANYSLKNAEEVVNLVGSTIANNSVVYDNGVSKSGKHGGGIYFNEDYASVTGINFVGNYSDHGGAIYVNEEDISITNCSIIANQSRHSGSAIYVGNDNFSLTDSSIMYNLSNGYDVYLSAVFVSFHHDIELNGKIYIKDNSSPRNPKYSNLFLTTSGFYSAYIIGNPSIDSDIHLNAYLEDSLFGGRDITEEPGNYNVQVYTSDDPDYFVGWDRDGDRKLKKYAVADYTSSERAYLMGKSTSIVIDVSDSLNIGDLNESMGITFLRGKGLISYDEETGEVRNQSSKLLFTVENGIVDIASGVTSDDSIEYTLTNADKTGPFAIIDSIYLRLNIEYVKYTVSFKDGDKILESKDIEEGTILERPDSDPTKEGYRFVNWYSNEGLTNEFNFNTPITENTTIYAKFIEQSLVTFKDGETTLGTEAVDKGEKVARPDPAPTKIGYTFAGWYIDPGFANEFDFDTSIAADITIYAKFTEDSIGTYKVSFDANGGSGTMEDVTGLSGTYTLPSNGFTAPEDKKFKGWSLTSDGSIITTVEMTEDKTVYAIWEYIIPTYQVTFIDGVSVLSIRDVRDGELVSKPEDPIKEGYTFAGWYSDPGLTSVFDFDTAITASKTLYAKWESNLTITGNNQTFTLGDTNDIEITCSGELNDLIAIKVNGSVLDKSNYELVSGSTVLTLKNSYLNTLSSGTYKITFEYGNNSKDATLNVVEASNNTDNTNTNNNDTNNPQTSYNVVEYIYTLIIGIICLAGGTVYLKRKKLFGSR